MIIFYVPHLPLYRELLQYNLKVYKYRVMDPHQQAPSPENDPMSEPQSQADFLRLHEQYIAERKAWKKQLRRQIKEKFGESSSEDDSEEEEGNGEGDESSHQSQDQKKIEKQKLNKAALQDYKLSKINVEEAGQKIEVLTPSGKGSEWSKELLTFHSGKNFMLGNTSYEVRKIGKIKIILDPVMGIPYKIKITYLDTDIMLAATSKQPLHNIPPHYYLFARLVQEKLVAEGTKIRPFQADKTQGVPGNLIQNAAMFGKLNKKSQLLGKWEQRFIVINKEGLFSYKKLNQKQKYSWSISQGTVKQVWTRFEVQDNLLIIKVHHASKKTEFGLPMMDFVNNKNWLYHFYSMIGNK